MIQNVIIGFMFRLPISFRNDLSSIQMSNDSSVALIEIRGETQGSHYAGLRPITKKTHTHTNGARSYR